MDAARLACRCPRCHDAVLRMLTSDFRLSRWPIGFGGAAIAAARLEQSAKALADAGSSDFLMSEALSALQGFRAELLAVAPAVPKALREMDQPERAGGEKDRQS